MANSSDLKLISPNELDELLGRAQAERWSELALFGPADRLSQSREEWPDAVKVYRRVFQLSAYAKGLVAKLQPLTSLTSLNLSSNSIGEEGVSNLLEASASAPRADRVRQLDLRSNGDGGWTLATGGPGNLQCPGNPRQLQTLPHRSRE